MVVVGKAVVVANCVVVRFSHDGVVDLVLILVVDVVVFAAVVVVVLIYQNIQECNLFVI